MLVYRPASNPPSSSGYAPYPLQVVLHELQPIMPTRIQPRQTYVLLPSFDLD